MVERFYQLCKQHIYCTAVYIEDWFSYKQTTCTGKQFGTSEKQSTVIAIKYANWSIKGWCIANIQKARSSVLSECPLNHCVSLWWRASKHTGNRPYFLYIGSTPTFYTPNCISNTALMQHITMLISSKIFTISINYWGLLLCNIVIIGVLYGTVVLFLGAHSMDCQEKSIHPAKGQINFQKFIAEFLWSP